MKYKLSIIDYWNEYVEMIKFPVWRYIFITMISLLIIYINGLHDSLIFILLAFLFGIFIHYTGGALYVIAIIFESKPLREYEISITQNGISAVDLITNETEIIEWKLFKEKTVSKSITRYRIKDGKTFLFPHRIKNIDNFVIEIDKHR